MLECTDQIEPIGIRHLLQVLHDVSIFVPGEYQAEVGDSRRYPVERKDIAVLKLLHQHYFLAEPLCHLSERRTTLSRERTRHTYTFCSPHMGITSRHPENLERDHLILVHTLPNFGHLGEVLGILPTLHDALEFIWRWDCMVITAQLPKFNDTPPLRP